MVQVVWTKRVLKDIEEIAEHISKDSLQYAELVVQNIFLRALQLSDYPEMGHPVREIGRMDVREITKYKYRIIYRLKSESRIDILTIHHSSRLLANNPGVQSFLQ